MRLQVLLFMIATAAALTAAHAAPGDPAPASQAAPAASAPANASPVSRADAQEILDTLKNPEKRARFTSTLEAYVNSLPLQSSAATPGSKAAAAATAAKTTAPSIGIVSRFLAFLSARMKATGASLALEFRVVTDLPALSNWAGAKLAKDADRVSAIESGVRGLIVLAIMGLSEFLLRRLARRLRAARAARAPSVGTIPGHPLWRKVWRRTRAVATLVAAALVGNFLTITLLADYPVGRPLTFGLVNVYAAIRIVLALLGEDTEGDEHPEVPQATGVMVHETGVRDSTKLIVALIVGSVGLNIIGSDTIAELGATDTVREAFQKLVALGTHALLIVLVILTRRSVGHWIRRQMGTNDALRALGDTLAGVWPYVAVTVITTTWLVWAMDVPDAYHQLVRFVLATAAVLTVSRVIGTLLVQALDQRLAALASAPATTLRFRLGGYRRLGRATLRLTLVVATLIALTEAWGLESFTWFSPDHAGHQALMLILKLAIIATVGILAWEFADFAFEKRVNRLTESSSFARATRLRTLQPIIRVALVITLSLMVIMTALNEIGINVGPLLAGAGIFGVALGFGSQKLVQDFITGIFLLVEDAVDVGDAVTVAGLSGTVEHLSIRTIRLRAGDGSVHIIPFSSVTSVTNTNRGLGNAAVAINLDPHEDTDRVGSILDAIVKDMRADPTFSPLMLSDLDLWGVDKVDGTMSTLAGQIVCTDAGRWAVQREFNRRFKKRFQEEGIALSVPHQNLRIARAGNGGTAPALPPTEGTSQAEAMPRAEGPPQAEPQPDGHPTTGRAEPPPQTDAPPHAARAPPRA